MRNWANDILSLAQSTFIAIEFGVTVGKEKLERFTTRVSTHIAATLVRTYGSQKQEFYLPCHGSHLSHRFSKAEKPSLTRVNSRYNRHQNSICGIICVIKFGTGIDDPYEINPASSTLLHS